MVLHVSLVYAKEESFGNGTAPICTNFIFLTWEKSRYTTSFCWWFQILVLFISTNSQLYVHTGSTILQRRLSMIDLGATCISALFKGLWEQVERLCNSGHWMGTWNGQEINGNIRNLASWMLRTTFWLLWLEMRNWWT